MYYQQRFDTFVRDYDATGYITNTANFLDQVVNAGGTVFLNALSRQPQTLEELSKKVAQAKENWAIKNKFFKNERRTTAQ